jgi:hypothetical protein
MERLTKRLSSGAADYNYPASCYFDDSGPDRIAQSAFRQRCVEQLAEYEDTELTPEEVDMDHEAAEQLRHLCQNCDLERLEKLAEADKAGRVVVRPFNKALTNADRIRAATNQQLAKLLYDNQKEFCRLMYKNLGFEDELEFSEDYSDILAWLNAPSKEAEAALEAMKDGNG